MSIVYVLQSEKDPERFYVGLCTDLDERLSNHNSGGTPYTAEHRPWNVIVSINFADMKKAEAFERYLKSGSGREFCRRHF